MIDRKQRARLQRAINRMVKAEIEQSWAGSRHPADWNAIDAEQLRARTALKRTLDELTVKATE
jgi:hypothetical protein